MFVYRFLYKNRIFGGTYLKNANEKSNSIHLKPIFRTFCFHNCGRLMAKKVIISHTGLVRATIQ